MTSVVVAVAVARENAITSSGIAFINLTNGFMILPSLPFELISKSRVRKRLRTCQAKGPLPDSESAFATRSMRKLFCACQNNSRDQRKKNTGAIGASREVTIETDVSHKTR